MVSLVRKGIPAVKHTTYMCDDCKRSIDKQDAALGYIPDDVDICKICVAIRLQHSLSVAPLGSIACTECNHSGQVKDFYGPHNDYNWIQCTKCKGTGRLKLF